MQEEDKEYLRKQNVDHHSDGVVNKTIERNVEKHLTKCGGNSSDKFKSLFMMIVKQRLKLKI